MALLGKSKTLSNLFNTGILGDVTEGLGIGGFINFVDERTGGHLKGINVPLGRTVNGQPLSLNLTDGVQVLATTGLHLGGNNMMRFLVTFGAKKLGEAFGIIMDDPLPSSTRYPKLDVNRQSQPMTTSNQIAPMMAGQSYGGNYQ